MGTLWTPDGERQVGRPAASSDPEPQGSRRGAEDASGRDEEVLAEQLAAMRAELANSPAEVVVANHCYGLFELAALYLSQQPAQLDEARLAIDALGSLVDGLQGRLGEAESPLREGLSQLRLAYVQIEGASRAGADVASGTGANGSAGPAEPDGSAGGSGSAAGGTG